MCRTQGVCKREETQAVPPRSNKCQERREDNSQSLEEFSSHWNNRKEESDERNVPGLLLPKVLRSERDGDSCKRSLVSEV